MPINVTHLNAGTLCPVCKRLINGVGGCFERAKLVCHILLLEAGGRLILVDTGLGLGDVENPRRLGMAFLKGVHPLLKKNETAHEKIVALGYKPEQVTDICVTHLDLDHAGGIGDFKNAQVHVHGAEYSAALGAKNMRYVPGQFAHVQKWSLHEEFGDSWFGFKAVKPLVDNNPDILMIPLTGHSAGHCGIAVRQQDKWILHAGDAYFHHWQMQNEDVKTPLGLKYFQKLTDFDTRSRIENYERLLELHRNHSGEITIINSHDPHYMYGF